jgi:hypothetical protein
MAVSAIHLRADVLAALHQASASTGVDFDYLLKTARRESGLDPQAEASTSSAAGLFQFIDQTWLATLKAHGAEHGLSAYADAITGDAKSGYDVADPALKQEILAQRCDPETASAMAAELARDSARCLEARLGHKVDGGMLYAAHFLGVKGAATLLDAAATDPEADAAALLPQAAAANRSIFYDDAGRPVSVAALLTELGAEAPALSCAKANDLAMVDGEGTSGGVSADTPPAMHLEPLTLTPSLAGADAPARPSLPEFPARLGGTHTALRLTPEIVQILASFDPFPKPGRRDEDS